ncbi:MAG: glycosyltransferase [bacterium]
MKIRILHAPVAALYQPYLMVRGLKELGYKADYMALDEHPFRYLLWGKADISLEMHKKGRISYFSSLFKMILRAIKDYDLIHFHTWSFIPLSNGYIKEFLDLPFLKFSGKRIVFQFWGCDIRYKEVERKNNKYNFCDICGFDETLCETNFKNRIHYFTKRYGDVRLCSGDPVIDFPDIRWSSNAIDTDFWKPLPWEQIPEKFLLPSNGKLKIYHSFFNSKARGDIKGSTIIERAVETLQGEGFNIELICFDKLPNVDVRYYQMQADIIIEQIRYGFHGSTAVEGMAMGKPVISYIRDDVLKIVPEGFPIVNANPDNITDVLRRLVEDEDLRKEIGRRSREYAVKEHHYLNVAKRLAEIYESLF